MRRWLGAVIAAGLLAGRFGAISQAAVVCTLHEKLGVDHVKECEDYLP